METYKTHILSHDKVFLNSQDNNKRRSLYGRLKKKKRKPYKNEGVHDILENNT